jgi:acyl-CoA thioester hydrolase
MTSKIFQADIIVKQADLDELNHVNNVVYLQWVQDVAAAHWRSLASPEILDKYFWVDSA